MAEKATFFISADDEFIAASRAREIFERLSAGVADDMSKEIINGAASKADEAEKACADTIEAAATLSMFGGKKVVWLKNVNFIGDGGAGRTEAAREALAKLADFLEKLSPETASVVISACPVDRRKPFFKKMQEIAECEDFKSKDPVGGCVQLIMRESKTKNIRIGQAAAQTLASIVAGNPRMAVSELEKLSVYAGEGAEITERDVIEMVPIFGEGDFFDISNAFYSGDLDAALAALDRYFFANKKASARPIISTLQRQNSLLIQIRSLMDGAVISKSAATQPNGAIERAAERFGEIFAGAEDKSAYNIFSQNAWYAGSKLAPLAAKTPMRKLIDCQLYLAKAFEDLISRPNSDQQVMRDLFVLCITPRQTR
ncbi:MAG: DNA polymerase III subunit delta [Opitutales bacterium]|nr:DNA polymerase III subunit delta [Opitutales bacterium]